jgi:hypothetical protein
MGSTHGEQCVEGGKRRVQSPLSRFGRDNAPRPPVLPQSASMEATPLTEIHLPDHAATELAAVNVDEWIDSQAIPVDHEWWADELDAHGLNDPLIGNTIRRGDIFGLAEKAAEGPEAALALLWNAVAWGSGKRNRNNSKRIASVAGDPARASGLLMGAAELSHTSPVKAYELLYPHHRGAIRQLGPAFFTKYLYFAGAGDTQHPCAILDQNVARALHDTCGWASLPVKRGGWHASAYDRYCTLLGVWVQRHDGINRRDVIERWLFDEGKRLARS